jgi:hypothetical protein
LRHRLSAPLALALALASCLSLVSVAPAAAAGAKVVIIVGPTGSLTDNYRSTGDQIASMASAAGAQVVKVYSPNATWANVKAATAGAHIIVYLGHGNGFPNPYGSTELGDRHNGWGLNRTAGNGDGDNWSTTMVYCGEKALLGTLTSSDGAAQWQYCGGANGTQGITPAPGFVMIYNKACYAPGAGEGWDARATYEQARLRVRNYSYPALALGAGAYFATDVYGGASGLVDLILRNPTMPFGQIAAAAPGYDDDAQRRSPHPDVADARLWLQRTDALGRMDYWYAFAGFVGRTFADAGDFTPVPPTVTHVSPWDGQLGRSTSVRATATFDTDVTGVDPSTFTLTDAFGFTVKATVRWRADLRRAVVIPSRPLVPLEWYTARLSEAILSPAGVPLAPLEWRFRTKEDGGDGTSATWEAGRALTVRRGTHTGYHFDPNGGVTATLTDTFATEASLTTSTRRFVPNQSGTWFHVTDGTLAGYWVRQSAVVHLADEPPAGGAATAVTTYDPPARITIRKGTHTGYRFDDAGLPTVEKTGTLRWSVKADAAALETVVNQSGTWFRVTSGKWDGFWLRASDVVLLAG